MMSFKSTRVIFRTHLVKVLRTCFVVQVKKIFSEFVHILIFQIAQTLKKIATAVARHRISAK